LSQSCILRPIGGMSFNGFTDFRLKNYGGKGETERLAHHLPPGPSFGSGMGVTITPADASGSGMGVTITPANASF
jgi:hypothetical protein